MTLDLKKTLPRPDGHHTLTPGAVVPNAATVIGFLERAFGAKVLERYDAPDGKVGHAELRLGDSVVMVGDAQGDHPAMPASLSYYVANGDAVDEAYQKAVAAGATSIAGPKNQFYGYRSACVQDAGGNRWTICAVVEQLSQDQILARMKEMTS
jgi:PhnB protein